jgi:hypothetical protein
MEPVPAASLTGRDRLSDLPDCLLHSVLSSLRSRQVVQSCLLSRRWRHLWRSVPCLDVDQRDFLLVDPEPEAPADDAPPADWHAYNKAQKEMLRTEIKRRRSFEDFADAMLLFHGASPLDACGLHVTVADEEICTGLHRWIRRGLARHPAELRVAYDGRLFFSFELDSGGAGARSVTSRLRRLHLSGLTISEKFAEELISDCPVLEDLKLVECKSHYEFSGRIASRSLKRLDIEGYYSRYSYGILKSLDVLAVPALVSLKLDKTFLPHIEDELSALAVASITEKVEYNAGKCLFLKSLRNAGVLELRGFTATVRQSSRPVIKPLGCVFMGI